MTQDWRGRLYDAYVSSGQGGGSAKEGFRTQKPYYSALVARHLPADRSSAILDLGCGAGGLIHTLKSLGYTAVRGADFSAEMVAEAHAAGVTEVVEADLFSYAASVEDDSLDVVFLMDVLEHLDRPTLFHACDEVLRILKPGGRLIVHVPNAGGIFGALIRYGDLTHERAFTEGSLRQLFSVAGFARSDCYEDKPVPHGIKSLVRAVLWGIGTFPFRLLYAAETGRFGCILSQNLLCVARAPG
ncbi:bifunctional 2-polyprenyl-6-hydroxyphenol methylase/3-demethylubiquinol 3-O-methyltransferase UbiG [Xanthobacter sp.]|uniref:class I SAM-dependent methyltransferase n=1 Tax=Xanthobacter sp. TaxID=35809 RepID=UPI002600C1B4|nr:class I SAM-dependent methyltransferase [Xanthobacter sp.]